MADNYALRKILDGVTAEQLHAVISTSLGHGCNITGEFGSNNTCLPILDYQKLREKEAVDIDTNAASTTIELEGKDYQEVNSSVSSAFGFSADKEESFNNSLAISTGNIMKNSNTYEYGIKLLVNKIMGARLTIIPQEVLKDYILPDAFCHINGKPDSNNLIPYPSDSDSIKKLFKDYGTHVITKGIFGCKYEYYLIREISDWESSITQQVNFDINKNFPDRDKEALGVGGNTDNSSENSQICEDCNVKVYKRMVGGNTSCPDIASWQYSCTFDMPHTLAMIGYNYNFSDNKEDSGLMPVWEFVDDSVRKQKMKEVYQAYVQENLIPIITPKRVIIDVIGKHFGKGENASDTMIMTDYTGKTRKYKKLNEEIMRHVKGTKKGSFYYYYATDFSTHGGISAVKFDNENVGKWDNKSEKDCSWAWQKRGNHSNEGVTGCLDNINVYVRPANRNDYPSDEAYEKDLVSGFGIEVDKNKKLFDKASSNQNWQRHGENWYAGGLCHDDVYCLYSKDVAK